MEVIQARNAHQALPILLEKIDYLSVVQNTRDGPALKFPQPMTIVYDNPRERVVFWKERDANPFFHLMEALWMLAGRRDVKFVEQFVKRMKTYSDDGKNFHAAYGFRWRKHFRRDQLQEIIENLKRTPECRRQVLDIWDCKVDLSGVGKDLPCNIAATFQMNHNGELDMIVHNRSNDAIMGALGANCVHFSILQEYIAAGLQIPVGKYWQVSSNMHVYVRDFEKYKILTIHAPDPYRKHSRCPYTNGEVETTPIVDVPLKEWEEDLKMWLKNPLKVGLRSQFFLRVATPMIVAHRAHKKGNTLDALEVINTQMPENSDWKIAAKEWLERRLT